MTKTIKKNHSDAFKLKVALAAIKGDKTVPELCSDFMIASSQIYAWKKQLEEHGAAIFTDNRKADKQQAELDKLYRIIGKITAERDFLFRALNR
jgi:transposase-like protein